MFSIHSDPLASLGSQECGGQNIYVKCLAEELGRLGWSVDVFTRWDNSHKKRVADISKHSRVIRLKGGLVDYVPKKELFSIFPELFENFLKFIGSENRYELFHGHYWDGGWMALEAAKKFLRPVVENFHSVGIVRMETKKKFLKDMAKSDYFVERINLENRIVRHAAAVISLSDAEKEALTRFYACPKDKIKVIKGGVNFKHWPLLDREKARETIGVGKDAFVVLFVGRLEWRKGVGTILSAAKLMRGGIRNLRVIVVGGKIFGPNANAADLKEYRRLQKKAEEEGVLDIVTFAGNVDHGRLPVYYRAADAFVIPSYYEPFGLVALEGMASKVPVIASQVGGLAATITDKVTGLLFEPRNALSLKDKVELIYRSKDLAASLVENAYREITQNYSWRRIAQKISACYDEVLKQTPFAVAANRTGVIPLQ